MEEKLKETKQRSPFLKKSIPEILEQGVILTMKSDLHFLTRGKDIEGAGTGEEIDKRLAEMLRAKAAEDTGKVDIERRKKEEKMRQEKEKLEKEGKKVEEIRRKSKEKERELKEEEKKEERERMIEIRKKAEEEAERIREKTEEEEERERKIRKRKKRK